MFVNSVRERYFILVQNCMYLIPGDAEHVHVFLSSYLNSLSTLSLSFSLRGGCLFVPPFLFLLPCTHSDVSPLSLPLLLLGALWANHHLFTFP